MGDAYLPIEAGSDYPLTGDLYFYDANAYIEVNDDVLTDKAYFAFRAQGGKYWFSKNEQNNSYFAKLDASGIQGDVTLTIPNSSGIVATQEYVASKYTYQTTAPTAAISDDGVHIVYLSSEPSTKYAGYIYMIAES